MSADPDCSSRRYGTGLSGRRPCGTPLRPQLAPRAPAADADAYVPLSFAPGEAYQFDWSHEVVLINGPTVRIKVAHIRRLPSTHAVRARLSRESQEMIFDAHDRAFAFFKGACQRGIYDNMKTAVETIFVGRERAYNRRSLEMCSLYLGVSLNRLFSVRRRRLMGGLPLRPPWRAGPV